MADTWRVVDADGHINEDPEALGRYLGPPFDEKPGFFPHWPSLDGRHRAPDVTATNIDMWAGFIDSAKLDQAVIYPTMGLAHGLIQDAGWAATLATGYNDWVYATYTSKDARVKAVALLSPQDVPGSAKEFRRAVKELGCVGGLMPAVTYDNAVFGKEAFWPLYEEAVKLNKPIAFHGAPQAGLGLECFDSHIEAHVMEHAIPQFKQMTSVIFQGVLDVFPKLRLGFLEAGAGWLPYIADRMDYEYRARPGAANIKRLPSDYLLGENVYVACEPEEPGLTYTVQRFGGMHILYPTDFPHELAFDQYLEDLDEFKEREDLSLETRRAILWDNPRRFYGLNG